ncbi:MAG: VWA domain-containing protein [Vicinamibacterales bacterium]
MKPPFRLATLLVAAAGSTLVLAQTGQAPSNPVPTFRAQVEYVEVDALVTDQQGQFVRTLTKDDFQVFEDGKAQQLTNFALVDIPVDRATRPLFAAGPIEPDVRSNERPFDGRVYVMVLDDLHVAALRSQRVKEAAKQFIARNLGANDLMAVVSTGGRSQDAQEFTSSKRLLTSAVDRFMGQKLDSITLARNTEYFRRSDTGDPGSRIPDPDELQRASYARSTLATLRQVAQWFGGVHGRRKTMLFFSEGIDYDITDVIRGLDSPSSAASGILDDIREAIAATARSNVSIYSVDPRGLTTLGDETIGVQQLADTAGTSGAGIGASSLANELRIQQDNLRQLAEDTGGFAVVNRNDYTTAFDRILADNSSYYLLAYYPPSDKRNGKFHRIEVKTTRPGLKVRSRRGYAAARGKAPTPPKTGGLSQEMFDTINSPLQVSGLTMRVFAAPFKGTAPNASVLVGVEMLGRDLTLDAGKVNISYLAVDSKSKVFGARNDTLSLNLRPDTRARVESTGLRVFNRMDIPAGRYQLRVAARDPGKANVGSVILDLEVPDFFKVPFGISGLTVTPLGGGPMMSAKPDEALLQVLPAPPVAQRTFAQDDELALFAEVYDNENKDAHKVDIATTLITDEGRVLYKNEETRDSSDLQGAKGAYGYTARVPLSAVPPGSYVLQVDARSRLGRGTSAVRQIEITVIPATRP